MRTRSIILLGCFCLTLQVFGGAMDYKQVLVEAHGDAVRVRLPLTDVTGKVRVKEKSATGFGLPVAPSKTALGRQHYLEWQIGYDSPTTNSPTIVPQISFTRKGETKYGHELSKILFEAVRRGFLSTNELANELALLKKNATGTFEESRTVEIEVSTNTPADGFQSAVQKLPQFTKTTPYGAVQIQLKQKQRAVGYQAMVYVCLPLNQVLTMEGTPRQHTPAAVKETVYYEFNHANAGFLLDIVHAFGLASQQHNNDMRQILGSILAVADKYPSDSSAPINGKVPPKNRVHLDKVPW